MRYFELEMFDKISIIDLVYDLQVLVFKLEELKVDISKHIHAGAIITKLPPN